MLIVVGLLAVVAVVLVVVFSGGGGSKGAGAAPSGAASAVAKAPEGSSGEQAKPSSTSSSGSAAVNPAETNVVVLNGTTTTGLAHRVSEELSGHGFSRAKALDGRPPGANQVTVVEYANGHKADAQSVARSLGVSQAQPIEGTVASLAGSASVVVIVGLDKAATVP